MFDGAGWFGVCAGLDNRTAPYGFAFNQTTPHSTVRLYSIDIHLAPYRKIYGVKLCTGPPGLTLKAVHTVKRPKGSLTEADSDMAGTVRQGFDRRYPNRTEFAVSKHTQPHCVKIRNKIPTVQFDVYTSKYIYVYSMRDQAYISTLSRIGWTYL